jgi:hypothetical protein
MKEWLASTAPNGVLQHLYSAATQHTNLAVTVIVMASQNIPNRMPRVSR